MSPTELAKSIWVKHHMARLLSHRAQQLGDRREARDRISKHIGRLNQQVSNMQRKMDRLGFEE